MRSRGYVLKPGDVVYVPALRAKSIDLATGQLHRFGRRGVPEKLNLQCSDEDGLR